jgi:Mn2+/Fe2+ NRAMP family transporter
MESSSPRPDRRALTGAVFLMATSAIGPGFLTQTTVFTLQLGAAFGFAILVSIALDIGAQTNLWHRIIADGRRAQEIAQSALPGAGILLTALIVFGGFAFNIGNLSGTGLGLQALTGLPVKSGALVSAALAVGLFLMPRFRSVLDRLIPAMGLLMVLLTGYVMAQSPPEAGQVLRNLVMPQSIDAFAILTIVGGTVGGYISFAGAHRLLDAGFRGSGHGRDVGRASVWAVGVASVMRFVLFLTVLGVIAAHGRPDGANPAGEIFRLGAGDWGWRLFGLVMWIAVMTSVIGSAYTSVSFLKTWHPAIARQERLWIGGFIAISACTLMALSAPPARILVMAGFLNGFVLPIGLGLVLWAVPRRGWLTVLGWLTVAATALLGLRAVL